MSTYISLLRAVNVGTTNRIKMVDLVQALRLGGFEHAETYIQTGNIVCNDAGSDEQVGDRIHQAIQRHLGLDITVIVRDLADFERIAAAHPFFDAAHDIAKLHVTFLVEEPSAEFPPDRDEVWASSATTDQWLAKGRELYMHLPEGFKQPTFTGKATDRRLKQPGTTRNWKVVGALLELAQQHRSRFAV